MARNLRPTCKTCRRIGESVCGKAKCALTRRAFIPGQHGPKQGGKLRLTEYGIQLREKQKVKALYGLLEKQLVNYFKAASKAVGNTSGTLQQLLEQRLDNVVYRAGFADTRRQARQIVTHGHFLVNGRRCDIPSRQMHINDVIELRPKSQKSPLYEGRKIGDNAPQWLKVEAAPAYKITIQAQPGKEDFEQSVALNLIVEYYSR